MGFLYFYKMDQKTQKHTAWIYVLFLYHKCLLTEADST